MATAPTLIRRARLASGLTQTQLAERAGITQTVVSAYERGRREPSLPTLQHLIESAGLRLDISLVPYHSAPALEFVRSHAPELTERFAAHGGRNLRVFGSVARGEATESSDVDLLVDLDEDSTLLDLIEMERIAESLLGFPVDVVPAAGLKPDVAPHVEAQAVAL